MKVRPSGSSGRGLLGKARGPGCGSWHQQWLGSEGGIGRASKASGGGCAISGGDGGLVLLGQARPGPGFRLGSRQGSGCGLR